MDVRVFSAACRADESTPRGRAKSCGPDAPTLASSSRETFASATEANKPGTPRRPRISRKPSRRECRLFWLPCVACVRKSAFPLHARPAGAACTRHSLRPLRFRGPRMMHHPGISCRGNGESRPSAVMPRVCGASSIPEASQLSTAVSEILDRPVEPGDDIELTV